MIRKVTLKNFKRFDDVTFVLPGHLVLAGPNNTGKTTLLQAIAAWSLGLLEWKKLAQPRKVNVAYAWADIERLAFSAAALRSFDLLWRNRATNAPLEIGLQFDGRPDMLTLEFKFQAAGLVNVRPKAAVDADSLAEIAELETVFIPAIGGLVREESVLADRVAIQARLAQARAGEVLRNLVVLVHARQPEWVTLNATLTRMFGFELVAPVRGAEITCEYRRSGTQGPSFDLASAGSGMLQVLLVLSLLLTHDHCVLLIDEPDAHLHLILQRAIYGELRSVAAARGSQLIIATHSEQVIDAVDPRELCLMYGKPRLVADTDEKAALVQSLGALTHGDLLAANGARGVLYVEDYTDADMLRAFARALGDEVGFRLLDAELVCKRAKAEAPEGLGAWKPADHWQMLKLVSDALPALELLDGDSPNKAPERVSGTSEQLQRLRWQRCEIENYLLHAAPMRRFLEQELGVGRPEVQAGLDELERTLGAGFDPLAEQHPPVMAAYLEKTPASKGLLPAVMQAAGLNRFPKSRYFEIAQHYQPGEVHPEVRKKLAQMKFAFGAGPAMDAAVAEAGNA
ncbi:MAG: AAA family ATPase [Pseudomonadota bacterium]